MGKSLIDNPLANNDVVINSVTGRRFSKEAIEENNNPSEEVKDIIKEDVKTKEPLNNVDTSKIEELIKDYEKEKEEDKKNKSLEEQLDEEIKASKHLKEARKREHEENIETEENKETEEENKKRYVKKTYLIAQENIDIIEGLALLTEKERKEIVEKLLESAFNNMKKKDPKIIDKALKELEKSKKKENTTIDIF